MKQKARSALEQTTDEHLGTNWKLLARGHVVWEGSRAEIIQDTFSHWSHHRGQMTVLMRQAGLRVPGVYGPAKEDWAAMGAPAMP